MPSTYIRRHGLDWPKDLHPINIDLIVAKKWREFPEHTFHDPHVRLLDAATALIPSDAFVVSPWTEEHAYDFVNYDKVITWGGASCSKSNDYGLFTVLHWITDPLHTVCLVGSTTLSDLKSRTWESIVRYHAHLQNNKKNFSIPGVFSRTGYAILNVADANLPESQGAKASIQGRALNEGGRLQGAHLPYVLVLVDELATISNHDNIKTALANLRVGAKDFRFYGLANPEDWADPSCQYCLPEDPLTIADITPDTGTWNSTFGCRVRHHDGLKSPVVLNPVFKSTYPFLMTQEQVDANLREAGGNPDHPIVWKMTRGFPQPASTSHETVIDMATINVRGALSGFRSLRPVDPPPPPPHQAPVSATPLPHTPSLTTVPLPETHVARVVGCDPAWSSSGDLPVWQEVDVYLQAGVPMLVFREPRNLNIKASSNLSAVEQLAQEIYHLLVRDNKINPRNVVYDGSGNQSLCGAVALLTGPALRGLDVNFSVRASDRPFSATDSRMAKEQYYGRDDEGAAILAEFIRAGQVRQLPLKTAEQMASRRWATKASTSVLMHPKRMESKEAWAKRRPSDSDKSPNHFDAALLAAIAVRELLGVVPWSNAAPTLPPLPGVISPDSPVEAFYSPDIRFPDSSYDSSAPDDPFEEASYSAVF